MAAPQEIALGAEFPTPTREQWLALVDKVLDGAPFERKLVSRTYDGLTIQPLYTAADAPGADTGGVPGRPPYTRGRLAGRRVVEGWDVRQHHSGSTARALNEAILTDLQRGVTSILLGPVDDLDATLAGVHLDLAPICLDWGPDALRGAATLDALWQSRGVPGSAALGELGIDPLAHALDLAAAARLAATNAAARPQVRALRVDATRYALAGASDAQELAFALATGVAYLRALVDVGLDVDTAMGQLSFTLAASPDQFATIAKLRAARRCWATVAASCRASGHGIDDTGGMYLHAITSLAHYSQRDPFVNPLRATLACFAAAIGGADAITVLPMGAAAGHLDDDGRRLARNTQIILAEESGLHRVADPAGGSHFVDRLTEDLAADAWRRFQEIEALGGMAAVLASGWAASTVEAAWEARLANLARRRDALTGVSEFPNLAEDRLVANAAIPTGDPANGFPLRRLAAPFEALRDAADANATRPSIFLANLGPLAVHTARATFAKNLFEVAGIVTLSNDGFADPAAAADAFSASGAPLAVICSSDKVYEGQAEAAGRALKAAGAKRVYLAGNPGERRPAYEAAGIDDFVFVGCDVLTTLTAALAACGVHPLATAQQTDAG